MRIERLETLACPMDGLALERSGAHLRCPAGHNYDMAREGYCNLLLVQQKASRDPGDSKEMVAARRRFLEGGHFTPIAERVFYFAFPSQEPERMTRILDAGCGEGYFLQRFAELAAADGGDSAVALAGIDVSKWAVKAAAKRKVAATWAVASNRQPPFLKGSVDLILCLFGFPSWEGFRGVQKAGGSVLLVDPEPEHLIELRRIIYPEVKRTPPPSLAAAEACGYRLARQEILRFEVVLESAQEIRDLLAMTPHGHRVAQDRRAAVEALDRLAVTVDVALRLVTQGGDGQA